MQLSTNLPYGEKGIRRHVESGEKLKMNVSGEADAALMQELKRTDSRRYARLVKSMQVAALAQQRQTQETRCLHCRLVLPVDIRKDAKYCDTTCQRNARRSQKAA